MALDSIVESLENVDETLRPFYTELEDGQGFALDIDVTQHPGARALKNALDQERKSAKEARQKNEEYKDVNLDEWAKFAALSEDGRAQLAKLAEGDGSLERLVKLADVSDDDMAAFQTWRESNGKKDPDNTADFEARLARATQTMRDSHTQEIKLRDDKITELMANLEKLQKDLHEDKINQRLTAVSIKKNANDPTDILLRAQSVWRMDDNGEPTAFDENGDPVRGKDGVEKITMDEWVESIAVSNPWLFKESVGGGGGGGPSARNGKYRSIKTKADLKTTKDKVAFIHDHGQKAFEELPAGGA